MSKLSTTLAALGVLSTLGLSTLPLASYAATTVYGNTENSNQPYQNVTINATVSDSISLTLDETSVTITDLTAGDVKTGAVVATVATNAENGFNLALGAVTTDLVNESGTTESNKNKIPTGTNVAPGNSAWGYKVGSDSTYKAVTSSTNIVEGGTTGTATTITFGVSVSDTQEAGTYTGSVTLTASVAD